MAGRKTYLPTLLKLLVHVCTYITKYQDTIKANIPETSAPLVDAVVAACAALREVLVVAIPSGV